MDIQKVFGFYKKIKEKLEEELFIKKINKRKKVYERINNRSMDEDEIKHYKFFLFSVYSFILSISIILILWFLF